MRTQLSLLALVVAIVAGQASADSVSPLREYYESIGKELNSIEELSSEEVVSRLREDSYPFMEVEKLLFAAAYDDDYVKVCNDHEIGGFLVLNMVELKDCTREDVEWRSNYCSDLVYQANKADTADDVKKANNACDNVRGFCEENVKRVKRYCKTKIHELYFVEQDIDPADSQSALRELQSGRLNAFQMDVVLDDPRNQNVDVCNGFKLREINEKLTGYTCTKEALKQRFDLCESLKNVDDVACTNVNLYCRYRLGLSVMLCTRFADQKHINGLDEQIIKDLNEAKTDEFADSYARRVRKEFRYEMSPVEKVIAKF